MGMSGSIVSLPQIIIIPYFILLSSGHLALGILKGETI